MFKYLFSNIGSSLSHDIARSVTSFVSRFEILNQNHLNITIMEAFWYVDIMILMLMVIFFPLIKNKAKINIINIGYLKKNKIIILLLFIPVFTSLVKTHISQFTPGNTILTYSMISPFIAIIISLYLFKKEKISKYNIIAFVFGCIGFTICQFNNINFGINNINWLLFFYVILNACSGLAIRYVSKVRSRLEGVILDNFIYTLVGIVGFSIFRNFNIKILFSWQILLITIPSVIHHIFVILGNQELKNFIEIIIADFLKIIFTLLSCYIFFNKTLSCIEYFGICVMFVGFLIHKIYNKHK